jgi:hypothetical protein
MTLRGWQRNSRICARSCATRSASPAEKINVENPNHLSEMATYSSRWTIAKIIGRLHVVERIPSRLWSFFPINSS